MLFPAPWVECVKCDLKPGIKKAAWKCPPPTALYTFHFGLVFFCRCEFWVALVSDSSAAWAVDCIPQQLGSQVGSPQVPHHAPCEVQECTVSEVLYILMVARENRCLALFFSLGKTHLDISKPICRTSCH